MAQHFPEGYEIVRAEEVVQGSRTLTVGATGSTEITPRVASHLTLLKVDGSTTRSEADTSSVTECRIIYRKAAHPSSGRALAGFAKEASLTPTCYLDPNTEARKHAKEPDKLAADKADKKDRDVARTAEKHVGE